MCFLSKNGTLDNGSKIFYKNCGFRSACTKKCSWFCLGFAVGFAEAIVDLI